MKTAAHDTPEGVQRLLDWCAKGGWKPTPRTLAEATRLGVAK